MTDLKTLIISHIDLDGFLCCLLFNYYKYPYTSIICVNYDEYEDKYNTFNYDQLKNYDKIIYTDFYPDTKSRNIIEENQISCLVLDHHKKQYKELMLWDYEHKTYIFDNDKCGGKLTYVWLQENFPIRVSNHLKQFIEYTNNYDLWKKDTKEFLIGKDINTCLYKYINYQYNGYEKFIPYLDICLSKIKNDPAEFYFSTPEVLKIKQEKLVEDKLFIKKCKEIIVRKDSEGHYFGVLKLNKKISFMASKILDKYFKLTYLIIINDYHKDKLSLSLRSRKGFNLLEYFENAGGHEEACGVNNISNDTINKIWTGEVYCLERKKIE